MIDEKLFSEEFLKWQRGVSGLNRSRQAAFMTAIKSHKDPVQFMKDANDSKWGLADVYSELAAAGVDLSVIDKEIADLKKTPVEVEEVAPKEESAVEESAAEGAKVVDNVPEPQKVVVVPSPVASAAPAEKDDKAVPLVVPPGFAPRKFVPRPIGGRDGSASAGEGNQAGGGEDGKGGSSEAEVEIVGEEPTGLLAKGLAKARSLLPAGKKKSSGSSGSTSRRSFGVGAVTGLTDKVKERWQIFAIGVIAIFFILSIAFLGPLSDGQSPIHSTGSPIDTIPVMAFFILLIMVPLFLEAADRNDIYDAVFVLLSVILSSTAVAYEQKWSVLMVGTRPLGTYIIGFLFLAPYLIMIMSAVTNRTRNVFASKIFSKLDFTPVYMTLLMFWGLAKVHVYWEWVPNPCFFPENLYLNVGILFLILELSGNLFNLGVALAAGILSGYLMFNSTYFYVVFLIYMIVMGYASTDYATREMTMNVDTPPSLSPEGGTSFGKGVRSKRFVPYDLLAGALWFTAITAVILKGNPAFPFTLPF